jgi:LPXTG-site transpeptidase (sortase) family protein
MLSLEIVVLAFALWRFGVVVFPPYNGEAAQTGRPASHGLTRRDVLPTPTPDASAPPRFIAFPGASMSAPIIPAGRVQGSWETRHLGDSVGHLVGTSWLGDPGGNIVLAGHVESQTGTPGPFAHLFRAKIGDLVVIREGLHEERFRVTIIQQVDPHDVTWLAQDGRARLTLITCTDWDNQSQTYLGRLVVVAEPVVATAQGPH